MSRKADESVIQSRKPGGRCILWLLIPWCIAVLAGFGLLVQYASTPGNPGSSPEYWPATTALARSKDRSTLLMFLHPHCPCSRASLEELNRILASGGERAETHVVFVRPAGATLAWVHTDLWSTAAAMPGVNMHVDVEGREAQFFGATTSGSTLLYNASGRLLFHGGITRARGHAGENVGMGAVLSGLLTGQANPRQTAIFGCGLGNPPAIDNPEAPKCLP